MAVAFDHFDNFIDESNNFISKSNNIEESHEDILRKSILEAANALNSLNFATEKKRKSITITDQSKINELLAITHSKARLKHIFMDLFADFGDGPKYNPYDIFTLPKGTFGKLSYSKNEDDKVDAIALLPNPKDPLKPIEKPTSTKANKNDILTTVGTYIFNRIFTEPISDILGYINEPITAGVYGDLINKKISYALLEDRMDTKQLKRLIDHTQLLMSCCSAYASSHTNRIFTMQEDIDNKKQEIMSRPGFRDRIKNGDLTAMKEMENELINYSKDVVLRDNDAIDMFLSGARATFGNNFKNMYLMRSGVTDTNRNVKIVTDSYIDGMNLDDYSAIADAAVVGAYSKSCMTAGPGHKERLFLGATAHLQILPPEGSDCGTKRYMELELTEKNADGWYYSYIIDGNKLVELTPEIAPKYFDKIVKLRVAHLCEAPNGYICEHCIGTLFRRLKMTNIGLSSAIAMSALKNGLMKAFHTTEIKLSTFNPKEVFA